MPEERSLTLAPKFFLRIFVLGVGSREVRKMIAPFRVEVWNDALGKRKCSLCFLSFSALARLTLSGHLAFSTRVEQLQEAERDEERCVGAWG